jgi:RNA polymerase sigma-70 factor (ECF subfamily)
VTSDARQRDESALLARIASGSEEAFVTLVGRYQSRFYSVARRMLGDDGEAQDAVQTTLLRVFRHAADYRAEWRTSTWLYRILTNTCVDQWRKRRRLRETSEPADEPSSHSSGADRLDVDRALAKLPAEARVVLVLCYVEELSYAEIAKARGITINTVKTQLLRAKRLMRKHLSEGHR